MKDSYLNCRPENSQRAQDAELRKKFRARRYVAHSYLVIKLFTCREEQKLRKNWSLHFMSEEEDGTIVVRKLYWRSDSESLESL